MPEANKKAVFLLHWFARCNAVQALFNHSARWFDLSDENKCSSSRLFFNTIPKRSLKNAV
ncbi:hypothetical protein JY28_06525 [Neisseria meningitidis]|nr:hypothetical protein [Neisseria meningitidis]RPC10942.1 hypothetical protein JY28_06525 [Neisseria meningitidis]RPC96413.1 hypothetical protein JY73_05885 [Neisseria meningitidis]